MENKGLILTLLLPALKETRALHDLVSLTYDPNREEVVAIFASGHKKRACVACDSGIAMIIDVCRQIV